MSDQFNIHEILFNNAGQGMIVTNNRGEIELINPMVTTMFGYTKDELVGQRIEILVPSNIRDKHVSHRDSFHGNPKDRQMGGNMDLQGQRKDGSVFSVEVGLNYSVINGEAKVVAIVTDITERVQSQNELKELNIRLEEKVKQRTQALEQSQKIYNLIARNFPKGIINVFDRDLNYVFVEGQELDKLSLSSDALLKKSFEKRFAEHNHRLIEEKLLDVFQGAGTSFEYEEGNQNYVANAVPLKNANGEIDQVLVIEKNITDSKMAEKEMAKNLERERELNELKSRFVSMASHEFRTPLSTILSSATLAEKYESTEQQEKREKHLNRIKSSVKNLTSILNDFLSIDKLEEGRIEVTPVEFELKELVLEAIEDMEPYLKTEQKVLLDAVIEDGFVITSDRNVIKNILINLLSNASKYSGADSPIEVTLSIKDAMFVVAIQDHGIGIPKAEQEQLFSRFFRAGNVTNIEGTGLGLTIVQKYLSLVNGNISFVSNEGEGTTFTIEIPIKL